MSTLITLFSSFLTHTVTNHYLQSVNEPHLIELAVLLSSHIKGGEVILLSGELGTGKSTFARAMIQALCGEQTEVASPTFMLMQSYDAPDYTIQHYDLYRIKQPQELLELGIDEAIERDLLLIEWPEMAPDFHWGKDFLHITISHETKESRNLRIAAHGSMVAVLDALKSEAI